MPDGTNTSRPSMIKHFLEWGNQDISIGDFIGLTFVTALVTMVVCFFY